MTLEELIDCSAEQLEKMSDAELLEHFKQFLSVTRPELAKKPTKQSVPVFISPQKKKALELLALEGIDIGFVKRKR